MLDSAVIAFGIYSALKQSSLFFYYDQILIQLLIEGMVVWLIIQRRTPFLKTLYWVIVASSLCYILAGFYLMAFHNVGYLRQIDIWSVITISWLVESIILLRLLKASSALNIFIAVLFANLASYGAGKAMLGLYYKYELYQYRFY